VIEPRNRGQSRRSTVSLYWNATRRSSVTDTGKSIPAVEKTKIIPFGKRAMSENTSKTFDFLGMTHYMGVNRNGKFRVKRKTSNKKYKASIYKCKEWIQKHRNMPIKEMWKKICVRNQGNAV